MSKRYEPLEIGINFGTKYLINESAYFLGGILAANEWCERNGERYFAAPVRHNKGGVTAAELELHFESVRRIAKRLSKETLMAKTIRLNGLDTGGFRSHVGFATFFQTTSIQITKRIDVIEEALRKSDADVVRCFLVGVFDGRGILVANHRKTDLMQIGLNCKNDEIAGFLERSVKHSGLACRHSSGKICICDTHGFMRHVGFISDVKFKLALSALSSFPGEEKRQDYILDGLKIWKGED